MLDELPDHSSRGVVGPFEETSVQLTSVGVDIGSSTSHLIFSQLQLEMQGTRFVTVHREILYESEILLTPYLDNTTIDASALGDFIAQQYQAAGLQRGDVDTGALILTGVALQRENAEAIGHLFAVEAGKFVAVSAGDNLEAALAAHGSGAAALSAQNGSAVLNVDLGGGTTKFALCEGGAVRKVAALDVGARLLVLDQEGVLLRLEEAGRRIGRAAGVDLRPGQPLAHEQRRALAAYMADRLFEVISQAPLSPATQALLRTPALAWPGAIDALVFSGGVSEFVYSRETRSFGDLGGLLGSEIAVRAARTGIPVLKPTAGIRATVIGASQYTVQLSGNTIHLSPSHVVPLRNIPVVTPELVATEGELDSTAVQGALTDSLRRFDLLHAEVPVAVAFSWKGSPTYTRLQALCSGVLSAMKGMADRQKALVLVCDGDVAGLLGVHLTRELGLTSPVICVDGIDLREFDYIDIGALVTGSGAVPVIIKSLAFSAGSTGRVLRTPSV
jgi:ethanolamine utilization protein EutA